MRLLLVAAALGCLAVAAPAHGQGKKSDTGTQITDIGGKTMEQWIKEIGAKDPSKRENAIRTVQYFGPDRAYQAVPAILAQLRKHTPTYPIDVSVRVNAAIALGVILGGVKDPEPKHVKESVTLLKRLLTDSQSIVRYRAAQALGRIGRDAREATPEIISLVKDKGTWETRQAAVIALGFVPGDDKIGPPLAVLNVLYGALSDEAVQVRLAAIQSLTWLGGPADAKVRANLLNALMPVAIKDSEPTVQIWANMAIMSIMHKITPTYLDPICKMLAHADVAARVQAAQAIGTIGRDAKDCIPTLNKTLADPEPMVVYWCIWALGRMEKSAVGAEAALKQIANDPNRPEAIKKAATEAIDQINGKRK